MFILKHQRTMKNLIRVLILTLFLTSLHNNAISQNKDELKQKREKLETDIAYANSLLKKTSTNKRQSLSYLSILETQIKNKERLITNLNLEIEIANKNIIKIELKINDNTRLIFDKQKKLENLKLEYAKMLYATYKYRVRANNKAFVLSSSDINQAYKRLLYLKKHASYRKKHAMEIELSQKKIEEKQLELELKKTELLDEREQKNKLRLSQEKEVNSVHEIRTEKRKIIKKLEKEEKEVKKQIRNKEKEAKKIEDEIRRIIREEIEFAKKSSSNKNYKSTPESKLTEGFTNNKGALPWPLETGVIVKNFGKNPHPVFKGVETVNNGIDIATNENTVVRSVFDGVVSRIFFIKGEGKAVLINHGEYFSVYSGLEEVFVKTGEKVLTKEDIGIVLTSKQDKKTQLHFEIWKGYDKENPSNWLYKAN